MLTVVMTNIEPLFELGEVVMTRGAQNTLVELNIDPAVLITRHVTGDWGNIPPEDQNANKNAVKNGDDRVLSAYLLPPDNTKVWVITEWDRSYTTILLPEEY
jgi:hypothetical protein